MKTSDIGISLIKNFESLHDGDLSEIGLQPKLDPIGIWTEGWGNAMRDSKGNFIRGIENKELAYKNITIKTVEEADKRLLLALEPRERIIETKIKVALTQNQFDALISHLYNTGGSDTLYKLINTKAPIDKIKKFWTATYITGGGVKLKGLIARRNAEANLYFTA